MSENQTKTIIDEASKPKRERRKLSINKVASLAATAALSLLASSNDKDSPKLAEPSVVAYAGLEDIDMPVLDSVRWPTISLDARAKTKDTTLIIRNAMDAAEGERPAETPPYSPSNNQGNPVKIVPMVVPSLKRRKDDTTV
jgi:hypothetical protein